MASRLVHLLHRRTRRSTCSSSAPFRSLQSFRVFYYPRRVTLTLETVTTISELHQSFLSRPLQSEGERMGGISLDQAERERKKREADDGLTPSSMGLAGVCDFVMNDVRCDAL